MPKNYNIKKISLIAEGDFGFVTDLVSAFLEEVPHDVAQLKIAIKEEDFKNIYHYSHKMKPTIDMFNIPVLDDVIAVQDLAKEEKIDATLHTKIQHIESVINTVVSELKSDFKAYL